MVLEQIIAVASGSGPVDPTTRIVFGAIGISAGCAQIVFHNSLGQTSHDSFHQRFWKRKLPNELRLTQWTVVAVGVLFIAFGIAELLGVPEHINIGWRKSGPVPGWFWIPFGLVVLYIVISFYRASRSRRPPG